MNKELIEIDKKTSPKIKVGNWLKTRKDQGKKMTCNTLNNLKKRKKKKIT